MHMHRIPHFKNPIHMNHTQKKKGIKKMKILNYTPHAITFKSAAQTFEIQSVGVARATTESKLVGFIDDLPIMQKSFGKVYGLPDPNLIDENTILIVSSLTAQAAKAENHPLLGKMYIVNDTLRDANGRITAATSLAKV